MAENVRLAWLEISAGDSVTAVANNHKFEKQIVPFTSNQYEFRTRIKAMDALERLKYSDKDLIYNLLTRPCTTTAALATRL